MQHEDGNSERCKTGSEAECEEQASRAPVATFAARKSDESVRRFAAAAHGAAVARGVLWGGAQHRRESYCQLGGATQPRVLDIPKIKFCDTLQAAVQVAAVCVTRTAL